MYLFQQKNTPSCNHEDEMSKLKAKIVELEGDKSAILVENKDLKDRVNALHLELSVKEAKWCEKEEQYNLKVYCLLYISLPVYIVVCVSLIITICHTCYIFWTQIQDISAMEGRV